MGTGYKTETMSVVFWSVLGGMNLQDVMLFDTRAEKGNGTMMSLDVKKVKTWASFM